MIVVMYLVCCVLFVFEELCGVFFNVFVIMVCSF